jgi:thiamine transporter
VRGPQSAAGATLARRANANPAHWSTAAISEMAIAVALAAALGLVKLFVMPQGGSVSLEMLPILFIAVRRGLVPALTVGVVYGCLQLLLPGAFLVQPVQVLLDYPLAFGALGLAGLAPVPALPVHLSWAEVRRAPARVVPFAAALTGAVALGVSARLVCHFLSGIIFFSSYAPAGQAAWVYSLTYTLL